jgi:oligopeptide transport system permease protein
MIRYAIRRILILIPVMLAVLTITFFIVNLAPGSPFSAQKTLTAEIEANLKAKYGFDQPRSVQYCRYLARLLGFTYHQDTRGYTWRPVPDFGDSTKYKGRTVNEIISESLPVSAVLGLAAYLIALCVGLPAGIAAALRPKSWIDRLVSAASIVGVSVPSFVLGPVLVVAFSLTLYWLPPARLQWMWEWGIVRIPTPASLVLPAVTLSAVYISYIARITQSGLQETLRQNYIRTARAKGLPERRVILVHALRGALLPVISFTGPALAGLVTGTVVVEELFAIPGLGHYFVDAANNRDYFLILGITAFASMSLMTANLLVDLAYAWIDPRITYGGQR